MDLRSPDTYARARPYTRDYANIHPLHHSCNVSFSRRFPSRDYPHGWAASDFIISCSSWNEYLARAISYGRPSEAEADHRHHFFLGTYSQLTFISIIILFSLKRKFKTDKKHKIKQEEIKNIKLNIWN